MPYKIIFNAACITRGSPAEVIEPKPGVPNKTLGAVSGGVWVTVNKGVRKFVKRGTENVPLELNTWHEIKIAVHGTQLTDWLDAKQLIDFTLTEPVSGKIGCGRKPIV